MSEQLKQQPDFHQGQVNPRNIYWVDVHVSGGDGESGQYESHRVTEWALRQILGGIPFSGTTLERLLTGPLVADRVFEDLIHSPMPDEAFVQKAYVDGRVFEIQDPNEALPMPKYSKLFATYYGHQEGVLVLPSLYNGEVGRELFIANRSQYDLNIDGRIWLSNQFSTGEVTTFKLLSGSAIRLVCDGEFWTEY